MVIYMYVNKDTGRGADEHPVDHIFRVIDIPCFFFCFFLFFFFVFFFFFCFFSITFLHLTFSVYVT